jgi:tetratricopeptide (TPR) repeat protein
MELIGRSDELEKLNDVARDLGRDRGRAVFVSGEPGIGKTALVDAFLRDLSGRFPEVAVYRAGCHEQYDSGHPYLVFNDLAVDIFVEDGELTTAQECLRVLEETAGPWLGVVPVVGGLASAMYETAKSVARGSKRAGSGGNETVDQGPEVLRSFARTVRRLATLRPTVVYLDDIHWADASSVTLLGYLIRQLTDVPLLIVATYRPADALETNAPLVQLMRELRRNAILEEVALQGLSGGALQPLARRAGVSAEALHRHTGGNPLFALELARLLEADPSVNLETLPTALEGVFERRIESLSEAKRKALRYASVEGDEFSSIVVARLLEEDEADLEDSLADLQTRHGLVVEQGEARLPNRAETYRYRFAHGLFQRRLYSELKRSRRRRLHLAVAEALEETHPDPTSRRAVAAQLIRHFREADCPARAYAYAFARAEQFADMRMAREALDAATLSGSLLDEEGASPDDPRRLHLALLRGAQFETLGRRAELSASLDSAREALSNTTAPAARVKYLLLRAKLVASSDHREATALREQAVVLARQADDATLVEALLSVDATSHHLDVEELAGLVGRLETVGTRMRTLLRLAVAEARNPSRSANFVREAAALAAKDSSSDIRAEVAACEGYLAALNGRPHTAVERGLAAREMATTPETWAEANEVARVGYVLLGDLNGAIELLSEKVDRIPTWNVPQLLEAHCELSSVLLGAGRRPEAEFTARRARELGEVSGNQLLLAPVLALEAEFCSSRGHAHQALDALIRAQSLAEEWGDPGWDFRERIGQVYLGMELIAEAVEVMSTEDERESPELWAQYTRTRREASVLMAQADFAALADLYLRSFRLTPLGLSHGYANWLQVAALVGRAEEARAELDRRQRELGPDDDWVRAKLLAARAYAAGYFGDAQACLGDVEAALQMAIIAGDASFPLEVAGWCETYENSLSPEWVANVRAKVFDALGKQGQLVGQIEVETASARAAVSAGDITRARDAYLRCTRVCDPRVYPDAVLGAVERWARFELEWGSVEQAELAIDQLNGLVDDASLTATHAELDLQIMRRALHQGQREAAQRAAASAFRRVAGDFPASIQLREKAAVIAGSFECADMERQYRLEAFQMAPDCEVSSLRVHTVGAWDEFLWADGQFEEALAIRMGLLSEFPDSTSVAAARHHSAIGQRLAFLQRFSEALPHLELATRGLTHDHLAFRWRALVAQSVALMHLGREEEAPALLEQGFELACRMPGHEEPLEAAEVVLRHLGDWGGRWPQEQERVLDRVERMGEQRGWLLYQVRPDWVLLAAWTRYRINDQDQRVSALLDSLPEEASDAVGAQDVAGALLGRASMQLSIGRSSEARASLRALRGLLASGAVENPEDVASVAAQHLQSAGLSQLCLEYLSFSETASQVQNGTPSERSDGFYQQLIGEAYWTLGRIEEAREAFTKVVDLGTPMRAGLGASSLAFLLVALGRHGEAGALLRRLPSVQDLHVSVLPVYVMAARLAGAVEVEGELRSRLDRELVLAPRSPNLALPSKALFAFLDDGRLEDRLGVIDSVIADARIEQRTTTLLDGLAIRATLLWKGDRHDEALAAVATCAEEAMVRGRLGYVSEKIRAYVPETLWRVLSIPIDAWAHLGEGEGPLAVS